MSPSSGTVRLGNSLFGLQPFCRHPNMVPALDYTTTVYLMHNASVFEEVSYHKHRLVLGFLHQSSIGTKRCESAISQASEEKFSAVALSMHDLDSVKPQIAFLCLRKKSSESGLFLRSLGRSSLKPQVGPTMSPSRTIKTRGPCATTAI